MSHKASTETSSTETSSTETSSTTEFSSFTDSLISTQTVLSLDSTDDESINQVDPSYIKTLAAMWKLTELLMVILCIWSLLFVKFSYIDSSTGRYLYFVLIHGIWIYLVFYMCALHFFERFQWYNLYVEFVYFALWVIFIVIAFYASIDHGTTLSISIYLGCLSIFMYEMRGCIEHIANHIDDFDDFDFDDGRI